MAYRLLLVVALFMAGCSHKLPNTWQKRVVETPAKPLPLHVDISGEGPPVILLHGFGASSYSFSRIIPSLKRHFRVYAFDLKGFGKSPRPDDHRYSVYDQAVLVEQYLKKHHLSDVIVIGHSYGGGVALSLALMDPQRIRKMVLIDSASYPQQLPKLLRWLQIPVVGAVGFYLIPASLEVRSSYRYAFFDDSKIPEDIVERYSRMLGSISAKRIYLEASRELVPQDIAKIAGHYRKIQIPTLIIWGQNDIVIRKDKAYRLHHDLRHSKLAIIPKCGHIPHEECPEKVIELLESFMLQ